MTSVEQSLREIACDEAAIPSPTGTIGNKDDTSGLYQDIHSRYVALLDPFHPQSIEALKRALFLQWYSVAEPPYLTGLAEPRRSDEDRVFAVLDHICEVGVVDTELGHMASWYYLIADFYFSERRSFTFLLRWLDANPAEGAPRLPVEAMVDRGLMGTYWRSVLAR